MTTFYDSIQRCSVCGAENRVTHVGSYTTFGSLVSGKPLFMGLDPLRNMINMCKGCGYCSPDLSQDLGLDPSVLKSEGYWNAKKLGGGFGAYAYLQSLRGEHNAAAYSYLHAAWIQDDVRIREDGYHLHVDGDVPILVEYTEEERAERREKNRHYREEARDLRRRAIVELLQTDPTGPADRMTMADMMRCIGQFDLANVQLIKTLVDPRAQRYWNLALFEKHLIESGIDSPNCVVRDFAEPNTRIHRFHLNTGTIQAIKDGRKTIEPFMNNTEGRALRPGHIIEFTDRKTMEMVYVDVRATFSFEDFDELYRVVDNSLIDPDNPHPSTKDMWRYPIDQQRSDGVISIQFRYHPLLEGW